MCILFIYVGLNDDEGDYSLVIASNRDEYYDRPAQEITQWVEDPEVFGGRDLQPGSGGGTWLAISPSRRKIGILLNLPSDQKDNKSAQSRGKIVADYVKSKTVTRDYIDAMKSYIMQCNGFVFVTAEFGDQTSVKQYAKITTYSNTSDKLAIHTQKYLGFGNCLPENPLCKVENGKSKLHDICSRLNKIDQKKELVEELLSLLRSEERHLPDFQLEKRSPVGYKYLSSIFVSMPEIRYGTRTHTLILVTKTGHIDIIEVNLESPVDTVNPKWITREHQFDLGF
ncbi:unnamed protein product [Diatraea saccharalis]|uniref:Uncharacterized protein n=1 Tax=Diatraea saccharalis TaxID=40085 RepID=A0A9N9WHZ4_9NEOP|nr:unnamed protein product [Diatraea saccharalis]